MKSEAAIERIKKLLRMKRGGTPAEVETALSLAREIAAKHGIDFNSIDPEERLQSELRHEKAFSAARVRYDDRYAAVICQAFFNVEVIYTQDRLGRYFPKEFPERINFIGRVFEIEIAVYVFSFLRSHFARSWKDRANRRLRSRKSFVYGMYCGILQKLREHHVAPSGNSLVISRKAYIDRVFGEVTARKSISPEYSKAAMSAGYFEGRATELRKGVERPRPLELSQ